MDVKGRKRKCRGCFGSDDGCRKWGMGGCHDEKRKRSGWFRSLFCHQLFWTRGGRLNVRNSDLLHTLFDLARPPLQLHEVRMGGLSGVSIIPKRRWRERFWWEVSIVDGLWTRAIKVDPLYLGNFAQHIAHQWYAVNQPNSIYIWVEISLSNKFSSFSQCRRSNNFNKNRWKSP
jgi:hypothetical protein